ncbi:MAG: UbiH/UbiF family hydroxylase [Qingshengfaniella sp.]
MQHTPCDTGAVQRTDVVVAGGGPAGLIAALALARAGLEVACVDPAPPVSGRATPGADLRSTALMQPSRTFLEEIGIWPDLAAQASPLRVMRLVDAGGPKPEVRLARDFDAAELGDAPFGWNVPNWRLRGTLARCAEAEAGITLRFGLSVATVLTRESEVRVGLSDGTRLACRLLIGADGRESAVRQAVGIGAHTIRYGQKALAFVATHPTPHEDVSTEVHRSGGPFTLVPLPDLEGQPCSAVIWMERGAEATRLMALPEPEFEHAATERACAVFGPLRLASRRTLWPIISRLADRLVAERTALVAEAAHVVPPIGAQGLNMSLADIRSLTELAASRPEDPGAPDLLASYQRQRWPELAARVAGVDALNRAAIAGPQVLRDLRMQGLRALHGTRPLRRALMRTGLGASL